MKTPTVVLKVMIVTSKYKYCLIITDIVERGFIVKFTIDVNTWRFGGMRDCKNKHGEGHTYLLNNEGYMCCLGQISLQLGLTK